MRVVVGVGPGPGGATAVHRAAAEARRCGGELCAVLAWQPVGRQPGARDAWRDAAAARLRELLDGAFGPAGPGVPVAGVTAAGAPGPVLVDIARAPGDLLVVGTGSRGLLHRALRTSPARYCLAHAACPVLVVPPSPLAADLAAVHRRNRWRMPLDARELDGAVR